MNAGTGKLLACIPSGTGGAHHIIAAISFTLAARDPSGKPLHDWGARLMLHSDLDDDTWQMWTQSNPCDTRYEIAAWHRDRPQSTRSLIADTAGVLLAETVARHDARHAAEMALEMRQMDWQAGTIQGRIGRKIIGAARDALIEAQENAWPGRDAKTLCSIARATLSEFRTDDRCPDCNGEGVMLYRITQRGEPIKCPACFGTGRTRLSDRQRCELADVPWSTYKRKYKRAYDWLHHEAMAARRAAVRHFRDQLNE